MLTKQIDELMRAVEGSGGTAARIYMSDITATKLDGELRSMRRYTSPQPEIRLRDGDEVQGMILHIRDLGERIYITGEPIQEPITADQTTGEPNG